MLRSRKAGGGKGVVGRGWFVTDGGQEVEEEEEVVGGG